MPQYVIVIEIKTAPFRSLAEAVAALGAQLSNVWCVAEYEPHDTVQVFDDTGTLETMPDGALAEAYANPHTECVECHEMIPDQRSPGLDGGSIANKHHAQFCSLYDADED